MFRAAAILSPRLGHALREAVSLFLEECSRKGTLDAILFESGFAKRGRSYRPRRIIVRAKVRWLSRSPPRNTACRASRQSTTANLCVSWNNEGFVLARESGDHMIFTKADIDRPAVVPRLQSIARVHHQRSIVHSAHFARNATWNSWNNPESPRSARRFAFMRATP